MLLRANTSPREKDTVTGCEFNTNRIFMWLLWWHLTLILTLQFYFLHPPHWCWMDKCHTNPSDMQFLPPNLYGALCYDIRIEWLEKRVTDYKSGQSRRMDTQSLGNSNDCVSNPVLESFRKLEWLCIQYGFGFL